MKKSILLFAGLAFFIFENQAQTTVTDVDGNIYNTVTIGTQIWMKENMRTAHYSDGTSVTKVTGDSNWDALTAVDKAYCWYNDDSTSYANTYGALYTWAAVMNGAAGSSLIPSGVQGICPTDWHIPSDGEWTVLTDYLINNGYGYQGSGNDIGKSMAETWGWLTNATSGNVGNDLASNNSSGFSALPSGYRNYAGGSSGNIGYSAIWWSATENTPNGPWYRGVFSDENTISRIYYNHVEEGMSVRCVCNNIATQINKNSIERQFKIYPNPATDKVYIDCAGRQNIKIQLFNIIGNCVFENVLTYGANEININYLPAGIYNLRLTGSDETFRQKLIKN